MPGARTYAAFISYSHATDHALGPLLQEGIEKFAKPWYRPRARRVFLDNSVLAAESDLTQAILDGLAAADNFLLLASPASARSPWVAKEVAWWLENRDRRSLFVLLTDGEAVWDNGVLDKERTSALPEALHDIPEPRCVDLRGIRDDPRDPGWEVVLADVVAPLDGIEKSELIGHHVRERRRTRRTVTATISVLAVLLVAAVIFAVRSEQQSDRAQQQTLVATSRQLVAQAAAIRDSRPDTARQLLAQAYRMSPTAEVLGALMESPSIPRVVPTGGNVRALAFAPGGETFAVARGSDLVVYQGMAERTRIPMTAPILDVAFHPDGKHVVAGTEKSTLIVDITDPNLRYLRLAGADTLAFAPGRPLLAAGSALLDLTEPLAPKEILTISDASRITISADGATLAVHRLGAVELWDTAGPARRGTLPVRGGGAQILRFAPKGAVLAVASGDQTVQLWNAANGELYSVLTGADLRVSALAFSADATTLAVGDLTGGVDLWDVTDALQPRAGASLPGHISGISALAFRADSRVLASAGADLVVGQQVVRLWQVLAASRSAAVAVLPAGGSELAFGTGRLLATGRPTTLYDLSDAPNPRTVRTLRSFNVVGQPVAFSPDGSRLAAGLPVVLMDVHSAEPPAVKQDANAYQVVFSQDGGLIGTTGDNGAAIWSRRGDEAVEAATLTGTAGFVRQGLAFSRDSRRAVAQGGGGLEFQLWDIADPGAPQLVRAVGTKSDPVTAVLFGPGDDHVVTGHRSGVVTIWKDDGSQVAAVTEHRGTVHDLALHPDGRTVASAGSDGAVMIWDLSDPARPAGISQLREAGTFGAATIAFSQDGALLGGADGTRTTIWSIDVPRLLERLCADSPRVPETVWRQYLPDIPYDPPCA